MSVYIKKSKVLDVGIIIFFLFLAPILSLLYKTNLLVSILLFYGLPSLWLSIRLPSLIKRTAFFSLLGAIVFWVVDYLAVVDQGWFVPTIFSYRLLNVLPLEDFLFFFLGTYVIVLFYEYFDDNGPHRITHTHMKLLLLLISILLVVFLSLFALYPSLLVIPYAYLWVWIVFALVPIAFVLALYPKLRVKFIKGTIYMACLDFLFEMVALRLNQWSFPGQHFIGWIEVGGVRFPLEELLFYILTAGFALLAYYELFDDDRR